MTDDYVGLELVVGGAVDQAYVVLTTVGQHTRSSCEIFNGLAWRFDVVGDLTGILATRHQVLVGLFRHLWHCSTPWLCSNTSTDRIYVNVSLSVMMRVRLHLTENFSSGRSACKTTRMVADLVGQ